MNGTEACDKPAFNPGLRRTQRKGGVALTRGTVGHMENPASNPSTAHYDPMMGPGQTQ